MVRFRGSSDGERELAEARRRIAELEDQLERLTIRDPLSEQLLTEPAFREQLELELGRVRRHGSAATLLVVEIDSFRRITVEHGFEAGDGLIVAVAGLLASMTRVNDFCCRLGEGGFALLLAQTAPEQAERLGARLCEAAVKLEVGPITGVGMRYADVAVAPEHGVEQLLGQARGLISKPA